MSKLIIPEHFGAVEFGDWTLFRLPESESKSFLWMPFKIMTTGGENRRRRGRWRSFFISWNPWELRLARTTDAGKMSEQQPDLLFDVELHLTAVYNRLWLARHFDDAEIEAERQRLASARLARLAAASDGA